MANLTPNLQTALSSLVGLTVIHILLGATILSQVPNGPPLAIGPTIIAMVGIALASIPLVWWGNKAGYIGSIIVGVITLILMAIFPIWGLINGTVAAGQISNISILLLTVNVFAIAAIVSAVKLSKE